MTLNSHPLNSSPLNTAGTDVETDLLILLDGPLGGPLLEVYNDFTVAVVDSSTYYVMDLVTPDGDVRVPIRNWQATLQTTASNYVQCVIPACADWVDTIEAATEFVIYRRATPESGDPIEYEMARAPLSQRRYDRGSTNYSCTISGYATAFAEDEDPDPAFNRTLKGIRSISTGQGTRVRCSVDWLLRPGQRAIYEDLNFVVGYINYYVPEFDAYMDVGSVA